MITEPQLRATLDRLVADGTLTAQQAGRVAEEAERPLPGGREPARLAELAAYVGGALVLAAVALLGAQTWADLSRPAKIALTGGISVVLLVAALLVAREKAAPRMRLASTLAALGALAAGAAAGHVFDGEWEILAGGVAILLVAVAMYVVLRGSMLVAAGWFGGLLILVNSLEEIHVGLSSSTPLWAAGLAGYGAVWLALRFAKVVPEAAVATVFGGLTWLAGAETAAVEQEWSLLGLLLGVVLIAVAFTGYAVYRGTDLLVIGLLATLLVPPTALAQLFDNWMVAVGALLVLGSVSLAIGVTHLRKQPALRG